MAGRGRPGSAPQTEKREQFARLIAQGVSNSQACRIVGVNRRTGKRWRHGRTITSSHGKRRHYPPVINVRKREISSRYLSEDERVRIADLDRAGRGVRQIAAEIGRSGSTISRELRHNRDPDSGRYRPFTAQRLAADRRARPGRGKLVNDEVLREFVTEKLGKRWSPEQICRALREQFPDQPDRHLVHETIYQAVYRPELGGLVRELPQALRTGRRRRKPHRRPDARRAGRLVDMTMIDQRPAEAADRTQPGHWEGDLITGEHNRSAIGTVVERSSRFTVLLHLPGRHTSEAVRDALVQALGQLPAQLRRSLTWDQGSEMARHAEITQILGTPVFFCDKASPWQRPSNENTNGLLRQYFPKGTDLRVHQPEDLATVAAELNDRPRKTLGWSSPAERLEALLRTRTVVLA
ncbi:MAG TPA: IS30 family transposase [Pseudonocardiaceae bacterium]|nr:IS30 family transposase [Pseudonocardiaceae bacterium]